MFIFSLPAFGCLPLANGGSTPVAGHIYLLSNRLSGADQFLSWTSINSLFNLSVSTPNVYIQGASGLQADSYNGWTFDLQTNSSYVISSTLNSCNIPVRLGVNIYGMTPTVGEANVNDTTQKWNLNAWGGDGDFQIYNQGWNKVLDVNGRNGSGFPALLNFSTNAPFMNSSPDVAYPGQSWNLLDITPVVNITATIIHTQTITIIPPVSTVHISNYTLGTTTVYSIVVSTSFHHPVKH